MVSVQKDPVSQVVFQWFLGVISRSAHQSDSFWGDALHRIIPWLRVVQFLIFCSI